MNYQNHAYMIIPIICILVIAIAAVFRNRKKILVNFKSHPVKFACLFVGIAVVSFGIFAAIFFEIALKI